MADAHGIARDQLRAFIERIERLEEEKKTIADDIKDVYGEAKGTGFDTKILREVIKIRKQDKDERAEREALLDTYMMALGMIAQPDFFDDEPEQREPVAQKSAALRRSDNGLNILTKHEDIRTAPETAEESPRKAAEAQSESEGNAVGRPTSERQPETVGSEEDGVTGGESAATNSDQPLTGGDHEVVSGAERAGLADPTSNTGEGAASALPAKPKFVLRPYCRDPGEGCGGSGATHCHSCLKAREEVAA